MSKLIDLTGQRFGRWTVISKTFFDNNVKKCKCRCDCGEIRDVNLSNLKRGLTKSCGCLKNEQFKKRFTTHGLIDCRLYTIWENMRKRWRNPKDPRYPRYGGRGITICDEWNDFKNFYDWAMDNGYGDDLSIDRINNNEGYSQNNCRWTNIKTQCRNRASNLNICINGVTKILSEWCEESGIDRDLASARIKSGWDYKDAIFTPPIKPKRVISIDANNNIKEYESVTDAANQIGVTDSAIRSVLCGRNKTCHGLVWKYANDTKESA